MIIEEELRNDISHSEDKEQIERIIKDFNEFNDFMIKKHNLETPSQVQDMFNNYMEENNIIEEKIEDEFEKIFEKNHNISEERFDELLKEIIKKETSSNMYDFILSEDYQNKVSINSSINLYIDLIS